MRCQSFGSIAFGYQNCLGVLFSYVGYARTTQWEGQKADSLQMIGFDMGGTSTDVSRFAGSYEHVFESTTAGLPFLPYQLFYVY